MVLEPHMDLVSHDAYATGMPDSSSVVGSEPREPVDAELDRLSIFEFSAADIFQHSPLGDVLNLVKKTCPWRRTHSRTISGSSGRLATKEFVAHPPPTS